MKYIVITSKHHDGFAMWRSAVAKDWSIAATPFQRDPLKELAAECAQQGLTLCFYHSIMDWNHPDYAPRRAWNDLAQPHGEPRYDRFVADKLRPQLRELLTGYGRIGILWFDGEWEKTWTHEQAEMLDDYVRALQPGIIVNNRVDKGRDGMKGMNKGADFRGDYGTPEQEVPATGFAKGTDWESCMTLNDTWGFKADDHNWKSATTLIRMLVDCASKGGNFLLNVGPTAEGEIPAASVERLAEVGRWMKANEEAVRGTTASPFAHLTWGRATQKPGKIFLHVFDWPADGQLHVPLASGVKRAKLLDGGKKLKITGDEKGKTITLPASPASPHATVIVLELDGAPQAVE